MNSLMFYCYSNVFKEYLRFNYTNKGLFYLIFLQAFNVTLKLFGSILCIVFMIQLCEANTALQYKALPLFPFESIPMALTHIIPIHLKIKCLGGCSFPSNIWKINGMT